MNIFIKLFASVPIMMIFTSLLDFDNLSASVSISTGFVSYMVASIWVNSEFGD